MWEFLKGVAGNASDAAGLTALAQRYNDKETMEAAVANMLGFAGADGTFGPDENKKMAVIYRDHPLMKAFDYGKVVKKHEELKVQFSLDTSIGHEACLTELRQIRSAPEEKRHLVMVLGKVVANSEGGTGDEEKAWGRQAADALGLDPAKYGF